jgi:hypothetical protein
MWIEDKRFIKNGGYGRIYENGGEERIYEKG